MKHVTPLSCESILTLQEMYKYACGHRQRQRAHLLLLSNKGLSINELSSITDLDRDTISLTLARWEERGLGGLYDAHRSGRVPIYNEQEQALIVSKIEKAPRQLKKVAADVEQETGKSASLKTLKRIAKRQGMVWKRLKKGMGGEPEPKEYALKKEALKQLKKKAHSGKIELYFQDESGFSLTPVVPYGWQYRGQTTLIHSERSQRLNVIGFLTTNNVFKSIIFHSSINAACFIQTIDHLFPAPEKETWVVVDNSPIHKNTAVREKIKSWARRKLHLFFLPTYSPKLNLIETLWRFIKYHWLPFNAYQSLKNLEQELEFILKNIGTKYQINFV